MVSKTLNILFRKRNSINGSRETPRGSRKKPNLGRSPRGRREAADVSSHISWCAVALLCRGREKSLAKRHGRSTDYENDQTLTLRAHAPTLRSYRPILISRQYNRATQIYVKELQRCY